MFLDVVVLREIEEEDSLWRQKSAKRGSTATDANQSHSAANESKNERTESVSDRNVDATGDTSQDRGGRINRFY